MSKASQVSALPQAAVVRDPLPSLTRTGDLTALTLRQTFEDLQQNCVWKIVNLNLLFHAVCAVLAFAFILRYPKLILSTVSWIVCDVETGDMTYLANARRFLCRRNKSGIQIEHIRAKITNVQRLLTWRMCQ